MTEYWQRTIVRGVDDEKIEHREEVLHRRGEDALVMACRRNQKLAGCSRISTDTAEAFTQIRKDAEESRRREDIPRDSRREDAWEW
jgi:hypothetical protein